MIKVNGPVILICDKCGNEHHIHGDDIIRGKPALTWWTTIALQLCKECRPALSDPGELSVKVNRNTRDTARKAAKEAMPKTGTQRYRVLGIIARNDPILGGGQRVNDEEVRQALGLSWTSGGTDTRRNELEEGGWVQDSGYKRKTRSNKDAILWELTPRGRDALRCHDFDLPDLSITGVGP